jgi:hypothetical protein
MKFNKKQTNQRKTLNYEGAIAYTLAPEVELYSLVCTAGLQDKFYEKETATLKRIKDLVAKVKPEFVAKLAVYAREQMHLRSIPLVLTVELAKIHKGDQLVSKLTERVIQRADEITELLAFYQVANARIDTKKLSKLSHQIKLGLAKAFFKFDEYNFAKYNQAGAVKLRDALFLAHPKPEDKKREELFKRIATDTLATPDTWEVMISACGKDAAKKKAVWEHLIDSNKLFYMATLRNLRNLLDADVNNLSKVVSYLSNEKEVLKSKQLPFRFLSAYLELSNNTNASTSMILDALESAVKVSAANIQGYNDKTTVLIACDVSGSMQASISKHSAVQYYDIGLMLGMLLQHRCKKVITGIFGDDWKIKQLSKSSILDNVVKLRDCEGEVGYSTNGWKVLEHMLKAGISADKVMFFTDCQLWDSTTITLDDMDDENFDKFANLWHKYKAKNPNAKLYLFDMAGYGTTPIDMVEKDVYLIAGWSDKIFDMLAALEKGGSVLTEINKIVV